MVKPYQRILFFVLASVIAAPPTFFGQSPPPAAGAAQSAKPESFVSREGGFSVDLPSKILSYQSMDPVAGSSRGGSIFTWQTPEGNFTVGFWTPIITPEQAEAVITASANAWAAQSEKDPDKVVERKPFTFNGSKGVELWVRSSTVTLLTRIFLTNDRVFFLSTGWPLDQNGATQITILDSFKIFDARSLSSQVPADASPPALPQSPIVKKAKSDAEDESLRGKVQSVIETSEYLEGTGSVAGIVKAYDSYYDEAGNLVKKVFYDYRGNPSFVRVYGYIDGKRVWHNGAPIVNEDDPPPIRVSPVQRAAQASSPPADARYDSSFTHQYDTQGRLVEQVELDNRGKPKSKTTYVYEGRVITELHFDGEGKPSYKRIRTYDEKGNWIGLTLAMNSTNYPADETDVYVYLAFDSHGNWTKREAKIKTPKYGGGTQDLHQIQYRTITYYEPVTAFATSYFFALVVRPVKTEVIAVGIF